MNKWLLMGLLILVAGCSRDTNRVVLYCAQDREFAETVLDEFRKSTGIEVSAKYDTEANKSVSLYEEIVQEAKRPRGDVFWNNEIIGTIRLSRLGLLDPLPPHEEYPAWTRGTGGNWQSFAARARILIVNTDRVKPGEEPQSILDLADPKWKGKLAMAKPAFGTTATHAACLFEVLGDGAAKKFFGDLKANSVAILAGNKPVAERVAAGDYAVGLTDTDDAIGELDQKRPVKLLFLDQQAHPKYPALGTLFIPNTICVLKDRPHPKQALQLVATLLDAKTEDRLATAGGFQIPLSDQSTAKLHPALKRPEQVRRMEVSFEKAADRWDEVQKYLRDEFAR